MDFATITGGFPTLTYLLPAFVVLTLIQSCLRRSFPPLMAYPGGYAQPTNPRNNPFAQQNHYDADSELGDHYGNPISSTTHLAGNPAYYDQQHDSGA